MVRVLFHPFFMFCVLLNVLTSDLIFMFCIVVFFFKQKTAYEMRISDWSSDVCSSDLEGAEVHSLSSLPGEAALKGGFFMQPTLLDRVMESHRVFGEEKIGRASCRERVCQYV